MKILLALSLIIATNYSWAKGSCTAENLDHINFCFDTYQTRETCNADWFCFWAANGRDACNARDSLSSRDEVYCANFDKKLDCNLDKKCFWN